MGRPPPRVLPYVTKSARIAWQSAERAYAQLERNLSDEEMAAVQDEVATPWETPWAWAKAISWVRKSMSPF